MIFGGVFVCVGGGCIKRELLFILLKSNDYAEKLMSMNS